MTSIKVDSVSIDFKFYNTYNMNLKRSLLQSFKFRNRNRISIKALDNVSWNVEEGARIALIGENGAGKTTLLRAIAGSLPPKKGSIKTEGRIQSFLGSPIHGLDHEMSGAENIEFISLINGQKIRRGSPRFNEIAEFTGLKERLLDPVFSYSTGMKARLRFSILTAFTPDILLLDEGIGAADFAFSVQAQTRLQEFLGRAGILILASHSREFLKAFCTEGVWLSNGKFIQEGEIDEVYSGYIRSVENQA